MKYSFKLKFLYNFRFHLGLEHHETVCNPIEILIIDGLYFIDPHSDIFSFYWIIIVFIVNLY